MRHSTKIIAPACKITLLVALLFLISCNRKQSDNVADASMDEETMLVERRSYDESTPPMDAIAKQEVTKRRSSKMGGWGSVFQILKTAKCVSIPSFNFTGDIMQASG